MSADRRLAKALVRSRSLARDLERSFRPCGCGRHYRDFDLDFPRVLAGDLAQVHARDLSRDRDLAGVFDRDLARASARVRALARQRDFDREHNMARAGVLDRSLYVLYRIYDHIRGPRTFTVYRTSDPSLHNVLHDALSRAAGRANALSRARAIARAIDLANALDDARSFLQVADRNRGPTAVTSGRRSAKRRITVAQPLLAAATWVLPHGDRARYGEEFGSELADIADAGGGTFTQLRYATRVMVSSMWLRVALVSRRPRGELP